MVGGGWEKGGVVIAVGEKGGGGDGEVPAGWAVEGGEGAEWVMNRDTRFVGLEKTVRQRRKADYSCHC